MYCRDCFCRKPRYYLFALFLIFSLTFNACKSLISNNHMENYKNLSQLIYQYGDSSMPPPYHRSYTIVVNKDSVELTVDSYGDILAQKKYKMPEDGLQQLEVALAKNNIALKKKNEDDMGCTGGTTKSLSFSCHGEAKHFSAHNYYCGGDAYGDLGGDIDSFLLELKKLTPDLSDVIEGTK